MMKNNFELKRVFSVVMVALLFSTVGFAKQPFGGESDVVFANAIWKKMVNLNIVGENNFITSKPYKGAPPHGMILDLLEQRVTVNGVEGDLVVKKNYGGNGLTVDDVINNPAKYLKAITIMFQRENGYDEENRNWFYAKYGVNGDILNNPKSIPLAGRVAKGAPTGCIACHQAAAGKDFIFNHDRYK